VKDYYTRLLTPWAKQRSISLHAFEDATREGIHDTTPQSASSNVTLTAEYDLNPSPVSSAEDARFGLLAATIKGVFGDDVVVAPEMLTGEYDANFATWTF
jgi:Gly-Xaa carboxypeptidase